MRIRVIIPPHSTIRGKIRDTYTELYRQYHRKYPTSTEYPRKKLHQNIRNAISVGRITVTEQQITVPIRHDWHANGWSVIPCYEHWYFAVIVTRTKRGLVRAEIQDCCYESDYHNDVLTSKPYESIQNKINLIVAEALIQETDSKNGKKGINETYHDKFPTTHIIRESHLRSIIRETLQRILIR